MKNYQNYEDIDINQLHKGESVICRMHGAQGVGIDFEMSLTDEDGFTRITRVTEKPL